MLHVGAGTGAGNVGALEGDDAQWLAWKGSEDEERRPDWGVDSDEGEEWAEGDLQRDKREQSREPRRLARRGRAWLPWE